MTRRGLALALGPALALGVYVFAVSFGLPRAPAITAAVTALCACWWVLEPIAIPATSLIPFAAFPLLGVLDHKQVAGAYGHTLILLLLGGFLVSTALEKSGAHRRLALGMVRLVGAKSGARLVLGFMLATATMSMWISNTAATLMMMPVALALVDGDDPKDSLGKALLLGIAYSASIGGLGTPIGTPPNVIFMGIYKEVTGREVSFAEWMRIGMPAVLVLLPVAWFAVTRGLRQTTGVRLPRVGVWRRAEVRVLMVFGLTALAWVTRTEPWGGWSRLGPGAAVSDSTVALAAAMVLFLVPDGEGGTLLDWPTARKIPWGLLLLFGG